MPYDEEELSKIDENLKFDRSWDQKTGFRTKQVLVYPIIYQKYLLGALQLINHQGGASFNKFDEQAITDLAKIIGNALYNQKRNSARGGRNTKFDYLLENHLVTQKDINKANLDARQRKEAVETVLIREYKVPKTEMGESLSRYYKVPYVAYNAACSYTGRVVGGIESALHADKYMGAVAN